MPGYDPQEQGCLCQVCPLYTQRAGGPVPPEWPEAPLALLVGEAPGGDEVKKGRPFIGQAGLELARSLASIGVPRSRVALTNALLCRPPDNELGRLLHRIQKENKRRLAAGEPRIPTPIECCRPRLLHEAIALPNVVTLGATAHYALTGSNASIMEIRGGPRQFGAGEAFIRLLPALHPAFVMRKRRWRGAMRADLARAFRWFSSGLAWKEPAALYAPRPAELRRWLDSIRPLPYSVVDVETFAGFPEAGHFDPLYDRLKCLGIGTADSRAVVVPFRSIEGGEKRVYSKEEQGEILELLRWYLTSPSFQKVTWNGENYDNIVVENQLGVTIAPHLDAIAVHRVAEPELPHDLGFAGSVYTDVDSWKQGHAATDAKNDLELALYNEKDTIVAALALPAIAQAARTRGQTSQAKVFSRLQKVCAGLHRNGMPVDEKRRREWDWKLLGEARAKRRRCQELAGLSALNPGSYPQIGALLFDRWSLAPYSYTSLGEPSTEDDALRAFLSEMWGAPEPVREFIRALRGYRKTVKRRGLVVRLRPIEERDIQEPGLVEVEEDRPGGLNFDWEPGREPEAPRRGKDASRACGLCLPDGRIHPSWLAHGTSGWRFSSSGVNAQNWEVRLRDIVAPRPGHVLVGCDEAQIELRMVAALAGASHYLEALHRGEDPHYALCLDFFPDYDGLSEAQKKRLRRFVKEFTYGSFYRAENETRHEILTSAEDDETEELLFKDVTLREVAAFYDKWIRRVPEIPIWWERELEEWRRQHFLAEPVLGLKLDLLDGEDANKIANYKAQSGAAAIVHLATFEILKELPFGKWGPGTGLIQQGHDSLVVECPEKEAEGVKRILEGCMTMSGRQWGLDVDFYGEGKIGKTWKEV